jgi:hypothetical protein
MHNNNNRRRKMKTISTIVLAACLAATGHAESTGEGGFEVVYDPSTDTGTTATDCGDIVC